MGVGVAHLCSRGRGGATSVQLVTLHCDEPVCRTHDAASSKEEYVALRAAGWAVDFAAKTCRCPEHSGVAPTVPVQQELVL